MERRDIESFFIRATTVRALVIGDLILDEYLWGKTERISPEAPVPVVDVVREDLRPGGAGNVVNNLIALGCTVAVCSVIGKDDGGLVLNRMLAEMGADTGAVFVDVDKKTAIKTRVVASNQQVVRIDRESRDEIPAGMEDDIIGYLQQHGASFDVFVVSDYLKGVLTARVLRAIIETGKGLGIPVVIDPKGSDYGKYRGATIIVPNRKETEQASRIPIVDDTSLYEAAGMLLDGLDLSALLITRSEAGMTLFRRSEKPLHIPTVAREVYDVTGAGDTVLALLSLGLAAGVPTDAAARLANTAAGIVVGKVGTSTVTPGEIMEEVGRGHRDSELKIKHLDVLVTLVETERRRGRKIVFTNGCFDLLHVGHVKYLQRARSFGDLLILGLNSDESIRRLKGESRPLIGEEERAHILAALDCIDYVLVFEEDTPLQVITALKPDVLVKGGDYSLEGVVGRELVESYGGRVELVTFVDGKSTTTIIEKILQRYS